MIRFKLTIETLAYSDDNDSLKSLIELAKTEDPQELALFLEQNLTDSLPQIVAQNPSTFKITDLTYELGESNKHPE